MKEQDYQRKIIKALEERGAYVVKVISASKKGVPDVIVCYLGQFIGVEVKQPHKLHTVTKLQKYNLDKIKKAGGYSCVASSIDDVIGILQEIENGNIS